ncbi:unnamed protein product [Leptosia nina]|uniref:Uncharacterized protein n=1 Tax=Leptosia nina TaxID=320188 RepID=A0AAV1JAQ9_9NEOP
MAGRKFYASMSTAISLSVAALILLSDVASAESARQCYWCGPLAEQVHRSRRAPPCDAPKAHVTICDPGLPHCAVVATAPPYVESRYCVKIYQDECYLDFCNTTKTWKMTCPCKGDLCNGQNSDREEQAFAELMAKTQKPQKKRTKKSIKEPLPRPIQTEDKKMAMVDPNSSSIQINTLNQTLMNKNEPPTERPDASLVTDNPENQITDVKDTTINILDDKATDKHENLKEALQMGTTPYMLESTVVEISNVNIEKPMTENLIIPNKELPTPEALQQNASSDDVKENVEESTLQAEPNTTTALDDTTTESPISRKNQGTYINLNSKILFAFTFFVCAQI